MSKFGLKIVNVLVGIGFCIGVLQTEASAKDDTEIPIPHKGFTIVLRAPTSENPRLIKVSKDSENNVKEERIQGLSVKLPKHKTVFFRIDQVNTVLYDVNITVTGEIPKLQNKSSGAQSANAATLKNPDNQGGVSGAQSANAATPKNPDNQGEASETQPNETLEIIDILTAIVDKSILEQSTSAKIQAAEKALKNLKRKLHAARALNSKLNDLLYKSEPAKLSGSDGIKSQATAAAKEAFKQTDGTSQAISKEAEKTLTAVYKACHDIQKDLLNHLPKHLSVLNELCNPANKKAKQVAAVFAQTVEKLRRIETAKWYKNDKQERTPKDSIHYTCVIRPALKLPEGYPELRSVTFVVVVSKTSKLSGRKATFGSFLPIVREDTCANPDRKTKKSEVQDGFTEGFGILTHIPLYSYNLDYLKFLKLRGAVALSGGFGLDDIFNSSGEFSLTQLSTLFGASLLLAAPDSESLLAFTGGGSLRPVERPNGNSSGDASSEGDGVSRPVRTLNWFFAVTVSYDIRQLLDWTVRKNEKK